MNNNVTIVMYHYVRELKHSMFPEIKGLDISLFNEQLKYLNKHYTFITMELIIDAIDNNTKLPENSVLLTFDDGYSDHFKYVFPVLDKYKIQGTFFAPVKAITQHEVLDVNKIHFILASEPDKTKIISEIKSELNKYSKLFNLLDFSEYYKKLAFPNRFDTADVIFIKRLLQVELNEDVRKIITNNLFNKIVGINEEAFSRDLYMDVEQLQCMQRNGMHIGSHGYDHYWLGHLDKETQKSEIIKSLDFLKEIGCDINNWTMCYPFGNYNDITLDLLKEFKCKLAVTTEVKIATLSDNNRFTLPRLDTNDLPKSFNS